MATIPQVQLPTLRGFLGAIALSISTTKSAVRGLYSLIGGLTQNDLAVASVVNALVTTVDGITSGLTSNYLWQTSGTTSGNTYTTFSGLYAAVNAAAAGGTVDVTIDGASSPAFPVNSTFALGGRYILRGNWVTGSQTVVSVGSNVVLQNLTQVKNLTMSFTSSGTMAITGSYPLSLDLENSQMVSAAGASNHAITLSATGAHFLSMRGQLCVFGTSGSYGVIYVSSGVTMTVRLSDGATLVAGGIQGAAGSTLNIYCDSLSQISGTLSSTFAGTINIVQTAPNPLLSVANRSLAYGTAYEVDEGTANVTSSSGASATLLTLTPAVSKSTRYDISVVVRDAATGNSWQCDYQARYDMGTAGSTPTASKALVAVNFVAPSGTLATLTSGAVTAAATANTVTISFAGLAGVANAIASVSYTAARV